MNKRLLLKRALEISALRPSPDLTIEQYLMTPESMVDQVLKLRPSFEGKKVFFLGDDDHMSVILAEALNVSPVIAEIDERIQASLKILHKNTSDFKVFKYDARNTISEQVSADAFYINPPYSSKNKGKGAKVWIHRASKTVKIGSTSVLVYPIDEDLSWTVECLAEISSFAIKCGLVVTNIQRDIHTYGYLPKDPGLLSSNIYLYKFADTDFELEEDIEGGKLYR